MKKLVKELIAHNKKLKKVLKFIDKELLNAPAENLRVSHSGNRTQYYLCSPEIMCKYPNGKYIRRENRTVAEAIARRDYYKSLKDNIIPELDYTTRLLQMVQNDGMVNAYNMQNRYRKALINPVVLPEKIYVERWLAQSYNGLAFAEGAPEIYSEKGERVRSKSEKIIADYLYYHHLPYLYEKPLVLHTGKKDITIYPDFTILDVENRREVYLEHFGMMDDLEYVCSTIKKIENYEKSGIYPGEQLLFTFESKGQALDTKLLENLLNYYFE